MYRCLTAEGRTAKTVTILAKITPRLSDLVLTRPVELINVSPDITGTIKIEPGQVDVLLNGPLPTLKQIENSPNLVRVQVDAAGLTSGKSTDLSPTTITPNGVQAQLASPSVLVTIP